MQKVFTFIIYNSVGSHKFWLKLIFTFKVFKGLLFILYNVHIKEEQVPFIDHESRAVGQPFLAFS